MDDPVYNTINLEESGVVKRDSTDTTDTVFGENTQIVETFETVPQVPNIVETSINTG
jgi:hypothetical protein